MAHDDDTPTPNPARGGGAEAGEPHDAPFGEGPGTFAEPPTGAESPTAAESTAGPAGDEPGNLEDALVQLRRQGTELEDFRQRALRAQAELENYRKRSRRELEDQLRYASLPLLRDLLPVMDNLQRAIDSAGQNEASSGLLDGVQLVAQQLAAVMTQHHCRPIQAEGAAFDPMVHEAIAQGPSDTHPAQTVMQVATVGYQLHDRVVRPAQVLVSTGPALSPDTTD